MLSLDQLIEKARAMRASDVHIVCGLPAKCRVDGNVTDLTGEVLTAADCEMLARELAGAEYETMADIGELDMARSFPDGGRTRVNLFRQQGSVSAAIRLLADHIPSLDELSLPPVVADFASYRSGIVLVTGETGSGKSTIIKLLTGEVVPTSGRVMVNGFSMSRISERQIPYMRRTIGVIFQDFRLIANKTVYDNLALAMRAVGASPKALRERIPYVLELVGLADKENRYPDELSGGEQQRVAIARALVNNPSTIVADEPPGNLDPARSLEIMTLLERINARGTTVIVVTHERGLVNRFNKRIILLHEGRVIGDGMGSYEV